ncbi:MAG: hypothetical protein L6R39_004871 [Caloplaca ligustica]|nr:MAG: hypothetical protein L6R39_004871 [Caloplaca ligustica]
MNQSEPAVSSGDIPAQDGQSPVEVPDIELHAGQTGEDEAAQEELVEKLRREREARAQALTLEIVGDLPFAEVKPPENVLFVCKLNPVTEDEDLDLIFSRFGKIISCEVIRDKRTGDSLQYAFIEFEDQKACEQAYFKMQGVLIDDHRIHVDFSQSVSRLSDTWRTATNSKRKNQAGGFGGVANLEKKRQYRAVDAEANDRKRTHGGYDMVLDKDDLRSGRHGNSERRQDRRYHSRSRSRSPSRREFHVNHESSRGYDRERRRGSRDFRQDRYGRDRRSH